MGCYLLTNNKRLISKGYRRFIADTLSFDAVSPDGSGDYGRSALSQLRFRLVLAVNDCHFPVGAYQNFNASLRGALVCV
jgi:hypothetical protein